MDHDHEPNPFEDNGPLEESERDALQRDLVDIETLKELLAPRGVKGAVFFCSDCNEDHFLAWDLLSGNLKELLDAGEPPIHEPAYDPDPEDYVSWDYASGFLDGYQALGDEELDAPAGRLILELRDRGWTPTDVMALFSRIGMSLPTVAEDDEGPPSG